MKLNLKKSLLISGAILSLLLVSGASISTRHSLSNPVKIEAHAATMYSKGYNNGYSSGTYFYRHLALNYLSNTISPYTAIRLYNDHAPVNQEYKNGYIKGYNNYSHKPCNNNHKYSYAKEYPKTLVNSKNYDKAINIYHYLSKKPYAYFKGYADRLATDSGDNNSDFIPTKYRHNINYAKGYLLKTNPKVNSIRGLNLLFVSQYDAYFQAKGRVPYTELFSHHYRILDNKYWNMIEHEEHDAMTNKQQSRYYRYYMNKLHLSKNDRKVFNYFRNVTDDGMGYNGGIGIDTGGYLWRGTGFALNLIRKSPFHRNVYYSKWAIDYDDGPLDKSSAFDGVVFGLHGNNTNAARKTANNLVGYIENRYYSKRQNKALTHKFNKNYKIVPIIKARHISGSRTDYTKGVSIYHVYNKHTKRSMVAYYIPDGKGPIGWLPDAND